MLSKNKQMQRVEEGLVNFTESPLYQYRIKNKYKPVIGEGSCNARIVFVGEAPGKKEAESGKPFCGRSGKMLDSLLEFIELSRSNVYITNIVKDRPQENRDPKALEIELYAPFLDRQLSIIQPEVIVTLGRFAMKWVWGHFGAEESLGAISEMHGKAQEVETPFGKTTLLPLYHPAVALYNGSMKTVLLEDFKKLKQFT